MRPGEYRWAADVPAAGETRVVIDTLTQLFYVYRGDRLIGVATISSGKKGRPDAARLLVGDAQEEARLQPQI